MAVLTQFFSKMYFLYVSPSRQKKLTDFFLVLPPEKAFFFRGGPDFQEWGCPAKLLEIALGKYEARLSEILTGDHCCSRQGNKFTSVFKYFWQKKYDESIIFVIQKRTFLNSRKSNQRMIVADCVSEL